MLYLESLDISSFVMGQLTLTWAFQPTVEELTNYTLDIYRSEAPGVGTSLDGYDLVTSGLSATDYSYDDTGVAGLYDPLRTWYYKIRLTDTVSEDTDVQPDRPAYRKGVTADLHALELIRRKSISIDRLAGRDFYILKRRTFGTHCPVCWDGTLFRQSESSCETCFDTGWVDGYFTSAYARGMLDPSPKYNQITMFGEWMPQDALFTMLNFPPIRSKDVIVDDANKRWIVKSVRSIEKEGFVIEQNAQCSLIAYDDIVYDIDNDIGLASELPTISIDPRVNYGRDFLVTKTYLEEQIAGDSSFFFQRFLGSDRQSHGYGYKFPITNQVIADKHTLANGSVQLIINGVHYYSQTDQEVASGTTDFHIDGTDVIVHNKTNNGTMDLIDADVIGVYYQIDAQ